MSVNDGKSGRSQLEVDMEVFGNKMSYNIYYGAVDSDLTHFSNPNPTLDCQFKGVITLPEGHNNAD